MLTNQLPNLTPREREQMRYEEEQEKRQISYAERMKDKEIELARMEAKWSAWLRIPLIIIKLPVLIILSIAYIVHAIMKIEPSENFWNMLK